MTVFGSHYALEYDHVYRSKNYAAECDLLESLFATYSTESVASILDLGCGTGGHAIPLAARGYKLVGVDRSGEMLEVAKAKAAESGRAVRFLQEDIRTVHLEERFDAVVMLFAVLSYQISDEEVEAAFTAARRHLRPGGLLIFDVWYGPAVLAQEPEVRSRDIIIGDRTLQRTSRGTLIEGVPVCAVTISLFEVEDGKSSLRTEETHHMRYFFGDELKSMLQRTGFSWRTAGSFPDFDLKPGKDTWNVLFLAVAE